MGRHLQVYVQVRCWWVQVTQGVCTWVGYRLGDPITAGARVYPQVYPNSNLKQYFLNAEQVKLAEHPCEALLVSVPNHNYSLYLACAQIFKDISDQFSQAKVPLAYEVISILEGLEHRLQDLQNNCET